MSKISVFLICKDEERIIEKTLEKALKIADEIIVVDSGSTDRTLEIAKKFTDKLYHQNWLGYSKQKAFALSLCSNKWVLNLDADELLTDSLIQEIKDLDLDKSEQRGIYGYKIARKLFIKDRFIRWGGYYPDYQLRLFLRSKAHYPDKKVHESVELTESSKVEKLKNPLEHFAYDSLEEIQEAYFHYAELFNQNLKNYKKSSKELAYLRSVYTFFLKYFFRFGFLDRSLGLKLALTNADYTYKKYRPSA
jgi:(heptosyl)LPS beta-1,4-glucosyltransferase